MPEVKLPVTRYYGSKRKLINKIWNELESRNLEFDSVLDVFGGTGTFSYFCKSKNKTVIYNDIFKFNSIIGKRLIQFPENNLTIQEANNLLKPIKGKEYKDTIANNFSGIYFTDEENSQIDIFIQNLEDLRDENKIISGYYILFQSCIIKRPYNLFHRNNLNMRLNYNGGNFGNKTTWERSFEELFSRFILELDQFTFDNGRPNVALNYSALECEAKADLVYIDPPYFSKKRNHTTYHSKYHFLEGLAHYHSIEDNINLAKANREIIINKREEFEKPSNFLRDLELLLNKHSDSHVVLSYRNNGIPDIESISEVMKKCKGEENVEVIDLGTYGYALNKSNEFNNEFLIIGKRN